MENNSFKPIPNKIASTPTSTPGKPAKPDVSRFDYIKYDETAMRDQAEAKKAVQLVERTIEMIYPGVGSTPKSKALQHLEECYMWIGKMIRDDQIDGNRKSELQEERNNADAWNDAGKRILASGKAESEVPDYRDLKPNGQQKDYVVMTEEERAKSLRRPIRKTYTHRTCGQHTTMSNSIAETYARAPKFYGSTFCTQCEKHFPVSEFVWKGTADVVGS